MDHAVMNFHMIDQFLGNSSTFMKVKAEQIGEQTDR